MEAGEAQDFAAWVQPHLAAMTRLAARMVSPADRDDVVQEALVRAWRRRSTYDERRGSALGWLLAIVADRARRHRTRTRPTFELVDRPVEPPNPDLDLERAVVALPPRQTLLPEGEPVRFQIRPSFEAGSVQLTLVAPTPVTIELHRE